MKTVMLFGTFDILHLGHIALFKQAKKYGRRIVAVVGRDPIVKAVKGRRPIHTEKERMELLQHIRLVDKVVLGDTADVYRALKRYRPDVIALGYDQKAFVDGLKEVIAARGLSTKIVRLRAYTPHRYKSDKLKRRFGI